jgi:hypothetical protein
MADPAYVASRETFFDAAVRYAGRRLHLPRVVTGDLVTPDPAGELSLAPLGLHQRIARNRRALKRRLMRRRPSGAHPVWFGEGRWAQHLRLVS